MSSPNRTILILGSGPGIGNHVAAEFVSRGTFNHAILLSRNTARLQEDAAFVQSKAPNAKVSTLKLDLADLDSIVPTLEKAETLAKEADSPITTILFNAARVYLTPILEAKLSDIELDFRTTNLALYAVAQWSIPRLLNLASSSPSSKPALLVTNSHLPWDPYPDFLSLSLTKASQRNIVQNLAGAFKGKGVHIGLVSVEGVVEPSKKNLNPKNIAEKAYEFWEGGEGLDVRIQE